jgi:NAD(P)-dependent dehydrogenase (short-subunit alcohol dehydrogenase family)
MGGNFMPSGRLQGQVAWISGGTKGIGEGTAKLFAEEGALVAITGRGEEDGNRVVKEIVQKGGKAIFIRCDVTKTEDIKNSIEKTVETFGGLHILINNAGTIDVKELHNYTEEEWDWLMNLNVKSIFIAFKYAFPYLSRNERSYVVNVGSISSFVGQDRTPVYTASKGAVLQLSKSIGLDYARYGIRCNCVCPGITETPLLHFHIDKLPDPAGHLKQRLRRVPLGRALTPEDVAKSIMFFSCEDSAGVTATSLIVDGGYLAAAEWDCEASNLEKPK